MMCLICGWRRPTRKFRCESCRRFYTRKGRDRTPTEVRRNWELVVDRTFDLGKAM